MPKIQKTKSKKEGKTREEQKKQAILSAIAGNKSNQLLLDDLKSDIGEEDFEEEELEEEKKEENDNSGGDNSGDGIPGGENPDPDEENDDVLKEESGSGSDGDSDDDEHKEFEINTSKKKKVAGVPQNPSKIILSSNKDAVSDDKDNAASEFETLLDYERVLNISRKRKEIRGEIEGQKAEDAINIIREKYGLTKEEIKNSEAVPGMMDPYFRSIITELATEKHNIRHLDEKNEDRRKAFEDFSEEMDQQMLINAMKAPDKNQIHNLEQYFRNDGDEKQLQREYKDKGMWKFIFGDEGLNGYLKSRKKGTNINGIQDIIEKRNKELETQKESARSLFKIFLLMQIGELKQRDTDKKTGRKNETDWKHNVSDLFAHGGRVMITTGEKEEAGTEDLVSSIFSKKSVLKKRSAATHYITEGKEEPGTLEEKRGKKAALKGMFSSDWNNYGMPVAVGGSGNLGPDKKRVILNDNRNGHLYVGVKEAEKYKRGGILIGLEGEAPYRMNQWGHYHTAKATAGKIKPTGGQGFDLHGDKTSGRNLYLRDIKNEDLITIMNAVDKEFDKLYGGERKEEYEGILQKITGKKLEQKELETILKDLTGLEKLHIDLKKSIPNIPDGKVLEETESDDSLEGMFNSDIQLNPDENPKKDERYHVSVSGNVSKESLIEKLEADNEKGKNDLILNFLKYQTLKEKKEGEEKPEPTEEEKEKIKKFENRKRFEVDKDDDENQENEENPLKSEEISSLDNYGPLLSEEEMDAIDPKAPDPDKEIIKERLEKEPLKQKGYVNEVGQEWLYDTDGSGKYYSAQADYTPDHFKDKKTAIDDSIFDMLSGLQEEKPEDTKEPNTEESSTEESNNHQSGLSDNPFKKKAVPEDDKKATEQIIEEIISNIEIEKEKEKVIPPELTANTTEKKQALISDFFNAVPKKTTSSKKNEQPNSDKLTSPEQKQNMEIKKEEPKEQQKEVEKIIKQPVKEEPRQKKPEQKNVVKAANKEVKSEPPKITNNKSKNLFDLFGIKKSSESTEPNKGPVVKADHVEQQKKSVEEKKIEIKPNENINKNIIEKKPKVEKIKEQPKLKQIEPKQVRPEKKVSIKPVVKKEIEKKQKEETKEQLEEVKQKITQSEVKPLMGDSEKNKTLLNQDKTLTINNPENNNVITQTETKNTRPQIINLTKQGQKPENTKPNISNNKIKEQPKGALTKPKQKIQLNKLNTTNKAPKELYSDWELVDYDKPKLQKDKPDNKRIRVENNLKPSDADLGKQHGGNDCFAFVASALMRYYGRKNNIEKLQHVHEKDLLKMYGVEMAADSTNHSSVDRYKKQEYGKFGEKFKDVRDTMLRNESMSMGDIVEAIHDLSGGKVALNIKVIERAVDWVNQVLYEVNKEYAAKGVVSEETNNKLKEAYATEKERQESLKDIIRYVLETKHQPVGILLTGDKGIGHYTLVTGLTPNGFKYRDSYTDPKKETEWTWENLFRVVKKIQVCFLENADMDSSDRKNYKDISKYVEAKDMKLEDLPKKDREKLHSLKTQADNALENNEYKKYEKLINSYDDELRKAKNNAAGDVQVIKQNCFIAQPLHGQEAKEDYTVLHSEFVDYYLYDDETRSYISLRPKKKKP